MCAAGKRVIIKLPPTWEASRYIVVFFCFFVIFVIHNWYNNRYRFQTGGREYDGKNLDIV
jgi:hypothetical protein